ncbi:MAG: PilN domain-containing protein [Pyrinomonadaceae bacterium]
MIRINLLESITDKPTNTVVAVEKKVSNPNNRFYLLTGVVAGLLILGIGFDYIYATKLKWDADAYLVEQQKIAHDLEAVIKEQAELDAKIKDVDQRISAIKTLRTNQLGPSQVLQALSERIGNAPGLYLQSVEQKDDKLTIQGNSPNEYTVSGFGRSLEFSAGLFSNLNIATQRANLSPAQVQIPEGAGGVPVVDPKKIPETVNFTITCAYTPVKANQQSPNPALASPASPANRQTAVTPAIKSAVNQTELAKN